MSEQDNRPVNLEALDPTVDTERFDRMVSSIIDESGDELASRRAHYGVIAELGQWRRPMMAAAMNLVRNGVAPRTPASPVLKAGSRSVAMTSTESSAVLRSTLARMGIVFFLSTTPWTRLSSLRSVDCFVTNSIGHPLFCI